MERMRAEEWKRLDVLKRVAGGELTRGQAGQVLGLTKRQVRRLLRAYEARGRQSLAHGNAGREPANRTPERVRERVLTLRKGKYEGFNDQHFTEKLEGEGLAVSRSSVRRWLREAGIGPVKRRRPTRHRRRRDRKAQSGLMVLWDGSRHEWLEDRGPVLCLIGAIDDATGDVLPGAHFLEQECAAGYLATLRAIVREKGVPLSAYMDRHSSLARNDGHWTLEEELRGEQDPTQVGRALQALGVEMIFALSPQAKGRVERLWGTLQDRLVSELRLAGVSTCAEANAVLARYVPEHNARFAIAAADSTPAWRPVRGDIERMCSFGYASIVQNDNTVRLGGRVIDIPPGPQRRSYAKAQVEVRQLLDGSWRVYHRDRLIAVADPSRPEELRAIKRTKKTQGRGRLIPEKGQWLSVMT